MLSTAVHFLYPKTWKRTKCYTFFYLRSVLPHLRISLIHVISFASHYDPTYIDVGGNWHLLVWNTFITFLDFRILNRKFRWLKRFSRMCAGYYTYYIEGVKGPKKFSMCNLMIKVAGIFRNWTYIHIRLY